MATASIADILRDAQANLDLVAEAEIRLAAAGQTSLSTWQAQARAVEFLTGRQRQQTDESNKLSKNSQVLRDAMKGVGVSMLATAATATATFAALRQAAANAGPGFSRALEGSMGILETRIAGALLPTLDMVTDGILEVADWFNNLSDGTKQLVANGIIAVPAVVGLATALRALSPVLALASAATQRLTAAARQNAMIGSLGAVGGTAAAAGTAVYAIYQLAQQHSDKYNSAVREQEAASGKVTDNEIREARRASRKFGRGDDVEDERFERMGEEERKQYFQARAVALRQLSERLKNHWWATEGEQKEPLNAALIFERAAKEGASVPGEEAARRRIERQQMRVSAINQENQPRYSPLTAARQQLQLQILGRDRYQQEILREQRLHRVQEIKKLDELINAFRQRFPNANLFD